MIVLRLIGCLLLLGVGIFKVFAINTNDSIGHWGARIVVNPASQLALDQYSKRWLHRKESTSYAVELRWQALPCDSFQIDRDYNYPTISLGMRYTDNSRVTMQRYKDDDWGMAQPVDYVSRLGNTLSLYGTFERAVFRTAHWETAYSLSLGMGWSSLIYDKVHNVDNELIGSHLSVYFGAGLHQTYRFAPHWGIRASVEFIHHSNGALARPNKGSNALGPSMSIIYYPTIAQIYTNKRSDEKVEGDNGNHQFYKHLYMMFSMGFGGKTLLEDWQRTQFATPPDNPDYRTEHFRLYPTYSFHADIMYRYARRWASGLGADIYYGTYSGHIARLDEASGLHIGHSPWSIGLSARHEVFYHRLSVSMALGYYLFRRMGANAREIEKPYYERIGLFYHLPQLKDISLGININAHLTKADFTELVLRLPFTLYTQN